MSTEIYKPAKCIKAPFESKKAALLEIKMQRSQQIYRRKKYVNRKNNVKTYCYECPRCGKWHLTTCKQKSKHRKRG